LFTNTHSAPATSGQKRPLLIRSSSGKLYKNLLAS
jgi:hypothetical protein